LHQILLALTPLTGLPDNMTRTRIQGLTPLAVYLSPGCAGLVLPKMQCNLRPRSC
jgi:hypothetical protein